MNQRNFLTKSALKSCLAASLLAAACIICTSCGDVYRPVANPIIPNQPNPGFSHAAIVISGNGLSNPGASTTIDVSGDTAISQYSVGLAPAHAAFALGAARVFVANGTSDTVSSFSPNAGSLVNTTTLAAGAHPVFVATAETTSTYVANRDNNTVSAISNTLLVVTNTIPVGIQPVSIAETPDGQKVYVANQGNNGAGGSVTLINSVDKTVNNTAPLNSFAWVSPVWIVARPDSQRVYVLDQGSGLLSAIDTTQESVVDSVSVSPGANYMIYDSKLNRIYVVNPVADTLTALEASTDALTATTISIANPISVAALPDGSRVYVSTATASGQNVISSVTVLNTRDLSVKTKIALTTAARVCTTGTTWSELPVAAAADSSRVYVGNCDAGNTAIINTLTDTVVLQLPAPFSAQNPLPNGNPPPQNPVFVMAGP